MDKSTNERNTLSKLAYIVFVGVAFLGLIVGLGTVLGLL